MDTTRLSARSGWRWGTAGVSRAFVEWAAAAVGACVVWTVAVVLWLPPARLATAQGSSRADGVLTTMATLSGAAIVLALTAILVGLQLSSRFGFRASRMVTTRPVAALMGIAALLGVALPLWAAAEPWPWLRTAGLACFAWAILVLGVAGSLVLAHLTPRWLAVHLVERVHRFVTRDLPADYAQVREAQSVLLEVANGSPDAEVDGHVPLRAIAYVALAQYRLTGRATDLSELVEKLGVQARSASHRNESPAALVKMLSLVGVVSADREVGISALRQQSELAQDAITQRREPVVRELLDEVAAFATDRLQALLEPATIPWLAEECPVKESTIERLVVVTPRHAPARVVHQDPGSARPGPRSVLDWIEGAHPPARDDAGALSGILPPAKDGGQAVRTGAEAVEARVTLVDPAALGLGGQSEPHDSRDAEEPIVIVDLAEYLAGKPEPTALGTNAPSEERQSEVGRAVAVASGMRGSDPPDLHDGAYDLLEAVVETLAAACAAPSPNDEGWPGGWRGSGAFAADVARLSEPALSLYKSGRFPPTDRVELAIEELGGRVLQAQGADAEGYEPADPIGWRAPERAIRATPAEEATTALRELAIEAWRAGFDRRALRTIRRLIAVFAVATARGAGVPAEQLADDVQQAVVRVTDGSDHTVAERWRSRQLALALAPELSTLGRAVAHLHDGATWDTISGVLDTIGWSSRGSGSEVAAEVYLHLLASVDAAPDGLSFGRPWEVVSWACRPTSQPVPLPDHLRHQLFRQLRLSRTSEGPRLAILAILALWRDALAAETTERAEILKHVLQDGILAKGRRDFDQVGLRDPVGVGEERPPRLDQPLVHWRVYDVAEAASNWIAEWDGDRRPVRPTLPAVSIPGGDLLGMIKQHGARALVDERDYWGVESGEDCLVLVQEADQSRRLLRDSECRARSKISWGYGGTGPYNLATLLVADVLGPLAYCPSCCGAIGVAAGLIACPVCENGMRPELWEMQHACNWLTAHLARKPGLLPVTEDTPPGAQWHIRRSDLLEFLAHKVTEPRADEASEDRRGGAGFD